MKAKLLLYLVNELVKEAGNNQDIEIVIEEVKVNSNKIDVRFVTLEEGKIVIAG